MIIGDPLDGFAVHEKKMEILRSTFPVCECCGEPIQETYLYDIDGEFLCEYCVDRRYRREVRAVCV